MDDPTDPAKVKVYGPGVEPGVKAGKPVWFTVDCTKAGKARINLIFRRAVVTAFLSQLKVIMFHDNNINSKSDFYLLR